MQLNLLLNFTVLLRVHVYPRAHAQEQQNRDPLMKTLLYSATSGQRLHRAASSSHLMNQH